MKKLIIMFVGLLVIIGQIKANPTSENQRIQELVDSVTRQEMSNNAYHRGIVYVETIGYNQRGEDVISFRRNVLVKKQNPS